MAGTLVTTKEGLKPIEEVKIVEYVLSRNEESVETSYKKVTDTLIRSTYNICTIELENGKIKSTTGHLFMVKDKWWKAAAELKAGDILETADGKCKVVKSITVEEKGYPVTTYNLSVEDNHTFFAGKLRVLTHNKGKFNKCELAGEVAENVTKGAGNPRNMSGVAIGGENLSNPIKSMRGSNGNIGFVPKEVADNLRGREFNSFDDFRNAFWQEYSTSNYASEFSKANIKRMSKGLAPKAPASQQYKNISSYVLHHKNPIYNGGGVYDLDNIIITSPRMHQEILDKGFHFNK